MWHIHKYGFTSNEHDNNRKYFLLSGIAGYISESYCCKRWACEVESCRVGILEILLSRKNLRLLRYYSYYTTKCDIIVLLLSLLRLASWSIQPTSSTPSWYRPMTIQIQASQWEMRMKQIIRRLKITVLYWENLIGNNTWELF